MLMTPEWLCARSSGAGSLGGMGSPLLFPSGLQGREGGWEGARLLAFLGRGMAREVKWPTQGHTAAEQVGTVACGVSR